MGFTDQKEISPMIQDKLGVVILNYNGAADTLSCLASLASSNLQNLKLFIELIDNGSSSQSIRLLSAKTPELIKLFKSKKINFHLERSEHNLGFTGGNNLGIKNLLTKDVDYILFLNNDTQVDKEMLRILVEVLKQRKVLGMISPKIYFSPGFEYHKELYRENDLGKVLWYAGGIIDWKNIYFSHRGVDEVDRAQYDLGSATDFITGCAMMIKTEVLAKAGLFDERYFLYLEDADLSTRVRNLGYSLYFEPKAIMWHKNASSSDKPGSPIHVYYQTRNRLLFGFTYASFRTKMALWKESLKMLWSDSVRRKAVLDYYFGKLGRK